MGRKEEGGVLSLISMIQPGEFPERKKPHSGPGDAHRDNDLGSKENAAPGREHRA